MSSVNLPYGLTWFQNSGISAFRSRSVSRPAQSGWARICWTKDRVDAHERGLEQVQPVGALPETCVRSEATVACIRGDWGGKYAPLVNSSGLSYATSRTRAIRALAGVCLAGGALFGGMWTLVGDGPTGLDRGAFAALATERGSFLAQAAKPLATIGPLLTGALVLALIAFLARRRRWLAAAGIIGGYLLVALAASLTKAAEQRPRPAGALIDAGGYSFPSTESALAIGLIAMAIVATDLTDHRPGRIEVIVIAGLLAGAIGTLLVLRGAPNIAVTARTGSGVL